MGSFDNDLGVVLVSNDLGAVSLGATNNDLGDAVDDELWGESVVNRKQKSECRNVTNWSYLVEKSLWY